MLISSTLIISSFRFLDQSCHFRRLKWLSWLKPATSELAVHHQAPLAFLILKEPKYFHGPEKSHCGGLHYSHVSIPQDESDYFRGMDLKLPNVQEKIKRCVKV